MVTICPGTQSESDSGIEESSEKISDLQNGDVSLQNPNNLLQHQVQNELTEKQLERYGVAIKEGLDNALAVIQNGNAVERSQTSGASSDDDNVSGTLSETSFQGGEMSLEPSLGHKPGTKHEVNAYDCNNFHVGDLVKNKVIVKCVVGTPNQESQESYSRESIENSQKKLGTITKAVAVGVSLTLILVVVTVALLVTQLGSSKGKSTYKPAVPIDDSFNDEDRSAPGNISWVSRATCGVPKPPKYEEFTNRTLPTDMVVIAHTATPECTSQDMCCSRVRSIQSYHAGVRQLSDIGYHFLVGSDGNIYEGRRWDVTAAFCPGANCKLGVAFIGNFVQTPPMEKQVDAALRLFSGLVSGGLLTPDYIIVGAKDVGRYPTDSPGVSLMEEMAKWPHFRKEDQIIRTPCISKPTKPT